MSRRWESFVTNCMQIALANLSHKAELSLPQIRRTQLAPILPACFPQPRNGGANHSIIVTRREGRLLEFEPSFTTTSWIARGGQSNLKLLIEGLREAALSE